MFAASIACCTSIPNSTMMQNQDKLALVPVD